MGEALIVSRGGKSSGGGSKVLKTEIITENGFWTVPKAIDQKFSVRIFGGGGGAWSNITGIPCAIHAGGGGFMNNSLISLQQGVAINITIGSGGMYNNYGSGNTTGGTTSFGDYLSAPGASGAKGGSGGGAVITGSPSSGSIGGGIAYQFGGGGAIGSFYASGFGGRGGYWGGGGGSGLRNYSGRQTATTGGNGGCVYNNYEITTESGYSGLGGNGGGFNTKLNTAQINIGNGINTSSYINIFNGSTYVNLEEDMSSGNMRGYGKYGSSTQSNGDYIMSGGGGGYGGNGGSCGGGGGGYGADGGNYAGGGGGYGGKGGSGINIFKGCGGGGAYGNGGNAGEDGKFGGGGGGVDYDNLGNGGNGICIIQYFVSE